MESFFIDRCFVKLDSNFMTVQSGIMYQYVYTFAKILILKLTVSLRMETNNQIANMDMEITHSLHWRHNGRAGVSNHQPHHCLLKAQIK